MSRSGAGIPFAPQQRSRGRWSVVAAVAVVLASTIGVTGRAGAVDSAAPTPVEVAGGTVPSTGPTTAPTTLPELPGDAGRIIPRPNSGQAPDDPGDPGGWQQTMLLLLVMGAIALMVFLAWRESKRKRARTGASSS